MTQYNTLSIKLSNSQLNELKSGKRNNTEITLKTSLNVVGDSNHSHKKRKDILETRAQPAIICVFYVENQAILQPILLYRTSKWKQTKEQDSDDCLWTHIFTFFMWLLYVFFFFFLPKCKYDRIRLCYNRLQFVKETRISTVSTIEWRAKLHRP